MNTALIAQCGEDAHECFLAHIFDRLWRVQAGTQFELDQFAEIGDKVLLRAKVSCAETVKIGLVEGLELQGPTLAGAGVGVSVADVNGVL